MAPSKKLSSFAAPHDSEVYLCQSGENSLGFLVPMAKQLCVLASEDLLMVCL